MKRLVCLEVLSILVGIMATILMLYLQFQQPLNKIDKSGSNIDKNGITSQTLNNDEEEWNYLGYNENVDTYVKAVPGTNLLAFRGVTIMDLNFSQVFGTFSNASYTPQWVDLLEQMKIYTDPNDSNIIDISTLFTNGNSISDVVYQFYNLPWPLSPRDFVFLRNFYFNENRKSVKVHYKSIVDSRLPEKPNVIRGESDATEWIFQNAFSFCSSDGVEDTFNDEDGKNKNSVSDLKEKSKSIWNKMKQKLNDIKYSLLKNDENDSIDLEEVKIESNQISTPATAIKRKQKIVDKICQDIIKNKIENKTFVQIESIVDNKGNIPVWFINYMQRSWPVKTLSKFQVKAKKGECKIDDKTKNW